MSRIIAFSLYGDNPLYLQGALVNARSAFQCYPGWVCRFYVGASVPSYICEQLKDSGAELVRMDGPEDFSAMLWRFQPLQEDDVEAIMIRDCDSRFCKREQTAVFDWLASGRPFHIMRDHPYHRVPILGGMWGVAGKGVALVKNVLPKDVQENFKGMDQHYLAQYVYPLVKDIACIHDAYCYFESHSRPFPSSREAYGFVGEVIDATEKPNQEQRACVERADTSFLYRLYLGFASLKEKLLRQGYWVSVP